ncbi:MAG: glycine--tRNA ligase, partial [Alphaproteobacteria bacterium]|nr:glycine--tRNA ligase [Alphaproteobacteria bacterium]
MSNVQSVEQEKMDTTGNISMDDLVALCKRRGFIFPASEIYGGINGFWDFGPLGILLKNNLRDRWWNDMVIAPPIGPKGEPLHIVGIDSSIIQNPKVWEASGHVAGFSDPMVDCRETKKRYRADHLFVLVPKGTEEDCLAFEEGVSEKDILKRIKKYGRGRLREDYEKIDYVSLYQDGRYIRVISPEGTKRNSLTEPRDFNLMFESSAGAVKDAASKVYLRPETAQGCFTNYKNIVDNMRVRVPFGIAQIGKAFRNEVTPRNFIYRSREFEQMEMEWFCHP